MIPPIAGSKAGSTRVKAADRTAIVYHYSPNLLVSLIQYFDKEDVLKKRESIHLGF